MPYVASWEGESEMAILPCRWAFGKRAVYPARDLVGTTRPIFGEMEPSRQRECVISVRCQVCHVELEEMSDKVVAGRPFQWLADLMHTPKTMPGHRLVLEPWVCDDCLIYALQVCPGLLGAKGKLRNVLAVFSSSAIGVTIIPHGNLEGAGPCLGYHKIEPLKYHRIAASHLLHYRHELRELVMGDPPPT